MHGIALLGGGIFARQAHLPALKEATAFALKAVWSRSEASAKAAYEESQKLGFDKNIEVYHGEDLSNLLAREDIKTVVLSLPIVQQPGVVKQAWRAGKNVISEKPVAKDVATGKELISLFNKEYAPKGLRWIIAEQWPYEPAFVKAREILASGKLGQLRSFSMHFVGYFGSDNQYYKTSWRNKPEYQGGFMLDGGVHNAAGLRYMLSGYQNAELTSVISTNAQHQPHLAPTDTMQALVRTDKAVSGSFTLSLAHEQKFPGTCIFHGSAAILHIEQTPSREFRVAVRSNEAGETESTTFKSIGVKEEMAAFAKALVAGQDSSEMEDVLGRSGPEATLKDVAFIEGLLQSGEKDAWAVLAEL